MKIIVIIAGLVVLAGCSDAMDANKTNFENVLNKTLAEDPVCFGISILGDNMSKFPVTYSKRALAYAHNTKNLNQFIKTGLVSSETVTLEAKTHWGGSQTGTKYDLTEMGKKYFVEDSYLSRFCYGNKVLNEIIEYTEPAETGGVKVSTVKYSYIVEDIPDWAKNDYLKNIVKEALNSRDEPIKDETVLYLTNKGWSTDN